MLLLMTLYTCLAMYTWCVNLIQHQLLAFNAAYKRRFQKINERQIKDRPHHPAIRAVIRALRLDYRVEHGMLYILGKLGFPLLVPCPWRGFVYALTYT